MRDRRGGIVGSTVVPESLVASGIWSLREAETYIREGTWPTLSDPFFSSVSLLLPFEGNGNTFIDASPSPATPTGYGSAVHSTNQFKWGNKSLDLTGSGYLRYGQQNTKFGFGTGDFTVEFWLYYTGGNGNVIFWDNYFNASPYLLYGLDVGTKLPRLEYFGTLTRGAVPITNNVWQHHAVVRRSGTVSIYLDGVRQSQASFSSDMGSARPFNIAYTPPTISCYMDDFRITKSSRDYVGDTIAIPAAPFPRS